MKKIVPVILFTILQLSAGYSIGEISQDSSLLKKAEKEGLNQQKINRDRE